MPILRAIAGPGSNISKGPVAVVHFDAHTDGYETGGQFFGNGEELSRLYVDIAETGEDL